MPVADFPDPPQIMLIGDSDAALPLDRLQQDAAGLLRNGRFEGRQIVKGRILKTFRQGRKTDLKFFLAGGRDGRQRP